MCSLLLGFVGLGFWKRLKAVTRNIQVDGVHAQDADLNVIMADLRRFVPLVDTDPVARLKA